MDLKKKEYVIDLIKKSISLGIEEEDIVQTLRDANLEENDARELIKLAKSDVIVKKEVVKLNESESKKIFDENTSKLSIGDQITMQLGLEVKGKDYSRDYKKESNENEELIENENEELDKIENEELGEKDFNKKNSENEIDLNQKKESNKKGLFSMFRKNSGDRLELKTNNKTSNNITTKDTFSSDEKKIENNSIKDVKKDSQSSDVKNSQVENESDLENDEESDDKFISGFIEKHSNLNNQSSFNKQRESLNFKQNSESNKIGSESKFVNNSEFSKTNSNERNSNDSIEELWKKGIVVAVNSRLDEMKKIKNDIDGLIALKVEDAVKKETGKFKILLESQKDLMMASNREALNQKQREISFIIDSKIAEIKKESTNLNNIIFQIESSKQQQQEMLIEIKKNLDDAKKTKAQLIIEVNSELIKSKSQAQKFIDDAKTQLESLDNRINKTLEFEKNIAQGLLHEAEIKIENLAIQKADELLEELELKLNKLKSIEKDINLDGLGQKIKILDQFKKEFLNNMDDNLQKINQAIEKINIQNELVSKEIGEKTIIIDAKIDELTKFEKSIANYFEKEFSNKKTKK